MRYLQDLSLGPNISSCRKPPLGTDFGCKLLYCFLKESPSYNWGEKNLYLRSQGECRTSNGDRSAAFIVGVMSNVPLSQLHALTLHLYSSTPQPVASLFPSASASLDVYDSSPLSLCGTSCNKNLGSSWRKPTHRYDFCNFDM